MNDIHDGLTTLLLIFLGAVLASALMVTLRTIYKDRKVGQIDNPHRVMTVFVFATSMGSAAILAIFDVFAFSDISNYLDLQGYLTNIIGQAALITWSLYLLSRIILTDPDATSTSTTTKPRKH